MLDPSDWLKWRYTEWQRGEVETAMLDSKALDSVLAWV